MILRQRKNPRITTFSIRSYSVMIYLFWQEPVEMEALDLTNLRKRTPIHILINYCCVKGKQELAFFRLADTCIPWHCPPGQVCSRCRCLQNPPHKQPEFRIFALYPEVSGCNSSALSSADCLHGRYPGQGILALTGWRLSVR